MKRPLTNALAAALLVTPAFATLAFAGEKPLPPAFGKELVPDEATQERNEYKAGEAEDEKDEREERAAEHPIHHRGGHIAGKVHIQLDGDEGGGDGDGDPDGGDF